MGANGEEFVGARGRCRQRSKKRVELQTKERSRGKTEREEEGTLFHQGLRGRKRKKRSVSVQEKKEGSERSWLLRDDTERSDARCGVTGRVRHLRRTAKTKGRQRQIHMLRHMRREATDHRAPEGVVFSDNAHPALWLNSHRGCHADGSRRDAAAALSSVVGKQVIGCVRIRGVDHGRREVGGDGSCLVQGRDGLRRSNRGRNSGKGGGGDLRAVG